MTTHLFRGYMDGDVMVVTSGITLCCHVHSLGIPKGDTGTVLQEGVDCPGEWSLAVAGLVADTPEETEQDA